MRAHIAFGRDIQIDTFGIQKRSMEAHLGVRFITLRLVFFNDSFFMPFPLSPNTVDTHRHTILYSISVSFFTVIFQKTKSATYRTTAQARAGREGIQSTDTEVAYFESTPIL